MPRKRIARPAEEEDDCEEYQKPARGKKHILTIQERIKEINAMLNAALAYEDLPHKVHVGFGRQLSHLEEQLEEARKPLDLKISNSGKKGKK